MDEISNGLDSSTTYQIAACLQQLAHITDATILISLLQPAPETFDLFDDIILMAEGKILYHGPRNSALEFFESCGFKCPERKGVADFLQEASPQQLNGPYISIRSSSILFLVFRLRQKRIKHNIGMELKKHINLCQLIHYQENLRNLHTGKS